MDLILTNISREDAAYIRSWVAPLCPLTNHQPASSWLRPRLGNCNPSARLYMSEPPVWTIVDILKTSIRFG